MRGKFVYIRTRILKFLSLGALAIPFAIAMATSASACPSLGGTYVVVPGSFGTHEMHILEYYNSWFEEGDVLKIEQMGCNAIIFNGISHEMAPMACGNNHTCIASFYDGDVAVHVYDRYSDSAGHNFYLRMRPNGGLRFSEVIGGERGLSASAYLVRQ
ncbi:MAG: hypothetical protein NTV34_04960 [Proteobacteria bacterium]|nr:hypothetical protein [Pseudomonadota bacterium]